MVYAYSVYDILSNSIEWKAYYCFIHSQWYIYVCRKYLPVLRDFPDQYIHEPWTAPYDVQEKANCIIGEDYPDRMIDHIAARENCMERLREFHKELIHPSMSKLTIYFPFYDILKRLQYRSLQIEYLFFVIKSNAIHVYLAYA